ncbi:MAG TPA: THUMP domain-containing protein [Hymenobacter sp.]|jgi:putative N6-adenine-specific DNA methylase
MHLTATTQFGLEELLADELYDLGADITHIGSRAVEFIGDHRLLYEVALWSRLSMRLLRPFAAFYAADEKALYREVSRIDWQDFLGPGQTFAITAVVNRSTFEHSLFVAQLTKDAIVDQFRARTGERPSVDTRTPDIRLHLRMSENEVILSLDAAGDSLHRRGYRQHTNEAPLNEVLAAGLVRLSGWDGKKPLIDPLCGSGTILTEAGLLAQRIAPGLFHQGKFGFENWYDFDPALWNQVREEAKSQRLEEPQAYLAGSDLDPKVIEMAAANITAAGLEDCIRLSVRDVKDAVPPKNQEPGVLITNPPYGERIGEEAEMAALYQTIGNTFKANFQGYDAFVLTGNLEAAKSIGLKTARRTPLFNGPIDCRLLKYELYRGSRRAPHPPAPSPAERENHSGAENEGE